MADVIATVWDFDKTLIENYMQTPLFEEYKIDQAEFWKQNNSKIKEAAAKGLSVNQDLFYLNMLLRLVREGKLPGLNNDKLMSYGGKQKFYPGTVELFRQIKELSQTVPEYASNGIVFENYIISSGLKKIIEGTPLMPYVKTVWGCEFTEEKNPKTGVMEIADIAYSIDNTTKTRALFEINKGANIPENNIDVNSAIPKEKRRVQFINMIYVADGPSDIPAFSVVNQHGGATFAVYPKGDMKALHQVEKMRHDGRVQMYAEANYEEGSTAHLWILENLRRQADAIIQDQISSYQRYGKGTPQHLV